MLPLAVVFEFALALSTFGRMLHQGHSLRILGSAVSEELKAPVKALVDRNHGIRAAVFADLDGEDIVAYPLAERPTLRHCAAYAGIALRRLAVAERLAGRSPVHELTLQGDEGGFITVAVADNYQLAATVSGSYGTGEFLQPLREAASMIEAQLKMSNTGIGSTPE